MDKERKLIIAGNWKMNKTVAEAMDLVKGLKRNLARIKEIDIVLCPPFTALSEVSKEIIDSNLRLGAQDMSPNPVGAFTGEIAAELLKEFLVRYVILGHSERRQYQKEGDALISQKAAAAHAASLKPILCVGESLEERESGQTKFILEAQLSGTLKGLSASQILESIIAYEPIWAIGTGRTATCEQAQSAHEIIRTKLSELYDARIASQVRIQYGGSVKPANARALMSQPDVDGALVGGASLDVRSFSDIITQSI